jgi:hypothetical protein
MLAVAFSIHDYFALIVGGLLLAAASVMRDAARLAEENAGFVSQFRVALSERARRADRRGRVRLRAHAA